MSDTYIFWEPQDAALCGLHALNTLLQDSVFHPNDLADIAQQLDAKIGSLSLEYFAEKSGNVDESGNFSIEVLRTAIKQSHNVDLVNWAGEDTKTIIDMTKEQGFIINRSSHWFSVRKIKGRFWNLNSMLKNGPELLSQLYLTSFLAAFKQDGYSVFIARGGKLPPGGTKPFGITSTSTSRWFTEKELLARANPSMVDGKGAMVFSWDEVGPGRRLVDKAASHTIKIDRPNLVSKSSSYAGLVNDDESNDPDFLLAQALSLSLNRNSDSNCNASMTKEQLRQKRLEALMKK